MGHCVWSVCQSSGSASWCHDIHLHPAFQLELTRDNGLLPSLCSLFGKRKNTRYWNFLPLAWNGNGASPNHSVSLLIWATNWIVVWPKEAQDSQMKKKPLTTEWDTHWKASKTSSSHSVLCAQITHLFYMGLIILYIFKRTIAVKLREDSWHIMHSCWKTDNYSWRIKTWSHLQHFNQICPERNAVTWFVTKFGTFSYFFSPSHSDLHVGPVIPPLPPTRIPNQWINQTRGMSLTTRDSLNWHKGYTSMEVASQDAVAQWQFLPITIFALVDHFALLSTHTSVHKKSAMI